MTLGLGYAAVFKLCVRCHNCRKDHVAHLNVPEEDDAPRTVDDLLESALLSDLRFQCTRCQGTIGSIVTASVVTERGQQVSGAA